MQEQIDERTKYAHWSQSAADHSQARLAAAELAISEYEQGRYVSELMTMEKDLVIAESGLRSAKSMLSHTELMAESGYKSAFDIEESEFRFAQAELTVKLKRTELEVLRRFTKAEESQTLQGNLDATKATHEANTERATADASRRDRAVDEFQHCVVRSERSGLVIHPSAAQWENAPEIAEGVTVHKDQVLLLMPDLSQMQVKVGIHESFVDSIKPGLSARVTLPDKILDGSVSSVASVTKPAGWWTGNEVKYDTIIELPSVKGLRPGMSAEVEVLIARYEDVLRIPVAAVVETEEGNFCWVKTPQGAQRRMLGLGDSNDVFTVVEKGLKEGDQVVLNPLAFEEPTAAVRKTLDQATPQEPDSAESGIEQ
jgi:multidrug efflux pump subunit AcrA (membrane-fusion protein)